MLRLLALRHAKSERNLPGKADFDRPLNGRGRDAAARIGRALRAESMVPRRVLCSPAQRTRETLAGVAAAMAEEPETRTIATLYEADGSEIMDCVREDGGRASPLMVVGHNPAIQDFALDLIGEADSGTVIQMRQKYPTGALAAIDFDIAEWGALAWNSGRLVAFLRPRELG